MFSINWKNEWESLSIEKDRRTGSLYLWIKRSHPFALAPQVPVFYIEGLLGQ